MILEKQFEGILCKYPELIEDGLKFKGRQITLYGKRMDILFEDKFGQKLIVELKVRTVVREHIGQVMEYEGGVLSVEDPTARIMLVGNRVPPNLKKALDHHGIEWKEITFSYLKEFLSVRNDRELGILFDDGLTPSTLGDSKDMDKDFSAGLEVNKTQDNSANATRTKRQQPSYGSPEWVERRKKTGFRDDWIARLEALKKDPKNIEELYRFWGYRPWPGGFAKRLRNRAKVYPQYAKAIEEAIAFVKSAKKGF